MTRMVMLRACRITVAGMQMTLAVKRRGKEVIGLESVEEQLDVLQRMLVALQRGVSARADLEVAQL